MSEKHLYEKHLAEKLQQVPPPPDMQQHWQEMKALLDEEMPRGGYFGRNRRWWRLGILAGILLIGGWLTGTRLQFNDNAQETTVAQTPAPVPANDQQASMQTTGAQLQQPAGMNGVAQTNPEMERGQLARDGRKVAGPANVGAGTDNTGRFSTGPQHSNASPAMPLAGTKSGSRYLNRSADNKLAANNKASAPDKPGIRNTGGSNIPVNNIEHTQNTIHADGSTVHDQFKVNSNKTGIAITDRDALTYSPVKAGINITGDAPSPADRIQTDFSAPDLKVARTRNSKASRAHRSRTAGSFSIGLSLPLAFPLGDQKALGYNFSAGANTISDYIPAPHLQYHFNDKTYLQTEVQVMAPQFIRPILLYQQKTPQSGNSYIYNSIYAKKLYYFNLPVGIHYSPFNGFYLGTGLQFSSLLSGVALYEETRRTVSGQQTALLRERYARFGGDSLSHRMNPSELRLLLEVNYYFNRFTVGLRYNQAFNNYVSFQVDPASPYTFDKNKALLFYLRYNLWENLKRNSQAKGLLSSK